MVRTRLVIGSRNYARNGLTGHVLCCETMQWIYTSNVVDGKK